VSSEPAARGRRLLVLDANTVVAWRWENGQGDERWLDKSVSYEARPAASDDGA
jgi:hypothetical protein